MDLQMNGKTALVTGGSAGIGKAIALALAPAPPRGSSPVGVSSTGTAWSPRSCTACTLSSLA
jgi:NAD(P)-dependent dehydrogenase (short-subunit alcohol dehydrogenase family)